MANQKVQDIIDKINEQESQIDNVTTLIADLRAQIAGGATAAELDTFLAELAQNKDKLSAALEANT